MLTRRAFGLASLVLLPIGLLRPAQAESDESFTVRVRADEQVRSILPPITLHHLTVEPDESAEAHDLAARSPPERAAPVILIIVGALALTQIVRLVKEMAREFYYGGVVVDGTKSPPEISNDPKIPADMVFVFQRDGTVKQFKSGDLPTDLISSVLEVRK